jgi:RNA polymerase sigma-70 factor (ECF subfamily)
LGALFPSEKLLGVVVAKSVLKPVPGSFVMAKGARDEWPRPMATAWYLAAVEDGGRSRADRAMERYADGDETAFGELFDAIATRLHAFLRRRIRDEDLTRDLVQQTFENIHRARGDYRRGCAVLPWAYTIARALLVDSVRRSRRDHLLVAIMDDDARKVDTPDQLLGARQAASLVEEVLAALPREQREAFVLVQLDELSLDEAGEVLGVPASTVKMRAFYAREKLREALEVRKPAGRSARGSR